MNIYMNTNHSGPSNRLSICIPFKKKLHVFRMEVCFQKFKVWLILFQIKKTFMKYLHRPAAFNILSVL